MSRGGRERAARGRWAAHESGAGGGFSLLELLVAMVVIATLAALLLPALAQTRETGRRVACAANVRMIVDALARYAADFRDAALLGYSYGWRQYSYLARQNTAPAPRWMGVLVQHAGVSGPAAWYCPSERDDLLRFNTASNPWLSDAPTGTSTRVGYGVRPVVDWPMPAEMAMPTGLARWTEFGGAAVAADLFHKATTLETRHRAGLNRGRGDGSVAWAARRVLEAVEMEGKRWSGVGGDFSAGWNGLFLTPGRAVVEDRGLWAGLGV